MPKNMKLTALLCCVAAAAMLGLAFAAVPLYDAFCRLTGYGGTPREVPGHGAPIVLERKMEIRFDANVSPDLPWSFGANEKKMVVQVGAIFKTSYYARNFSGRAITGRATYNVTPEKAGYYFSKIQCFCFTSQTLKGKEKVDMPIVFFVDPEIATDSEMDDVQVITLSYTFFPDKSDIKK